MDLSGSFKLFTPPYHGISNNSETIKLIYGGDASGETAKMITHECDPTHYCSANPHPSPSLGNHLFDLLPYFTR